MAPYLMNMGENGLSGAVCALVRDVRRVVQDGGDAREIASLHGRIGQLREELGVSSGPLSRYLDALQLELGAA